MQARAEQFDETADAKAKAQREIHPSNADVHDSLPNDDADIRGSGHVLKLTHTTPTSQVKSHHTAPNRAAGHV
jgi:hypothetical protein